jgi:DnaJ family protein C protein 7
MALKCFRLALEDFQMAVSQQSAAPSPKTLLRLGRCQLALSSSTPALSTIGMVLALEPKNAQAVQLKDKVTTLEGHMRNFESARKRKDWAMARLVLDKCLQAIEGEGGDVPTEWRIWRVELELSRGSWDTANTAAKYVHAVQ